MSFKDSVSELSARSQSARKMAQTEEATKNAVVMPFLRALGFDVFNPSQVIPEFVSDVGTKKGEKVDYAVRIGDRIEYLIEAKSISVNLSDAQYNQLFRYFTVTEARIAILTNGIQFWFFTDIEDKNKMDTTPFFKFDLDAYDENDLKEIEKFHIDRFDIEKIRSAASSLKYTRLATAYINRQWNAPDDEFVKFVARSFYEGNITKQAVESLRPIIKRAFDDLFRQKARQKFNAVLEGGERDAAPDIEDQVEEEASDIVTTQEELDAFYMIRAICSEVTSASNIHMRDQKSYCGILFENNNRKPIVRLHFNGKKLQIGFFDETKAETRIPITALEEIFSHKDRILDTIGRYLATEPD